MSAIGPAGCAFALVTLGPPVAIIALSPPMAWQDWALLVITLAGLSAVGRKAGAIVRHNAPFYAVKNIVVVGAGYGFLLAVGVFLISRPGVLWSQVPIAGISLLAWWGLQLAAYVGFQPDPIDWEGKTRLTAFVAMFIYVVALANFMFVVS